MAAYAVLHKKIIKSYAMDAILSRNTSKNDFVLADVEKFFGDVTKLDEKKHKSIGHEWDHRFTGKQLVGSGLIYRKQVLHAAFFAATTIDDSGRMSGFSNRRDYRM